MVDNEARGMDFQPTDGESPRQVWDRVRPWLAEIARAKQPTLAVAHRGVIRAIFAAAMNWDLCGRPPAKLDWQCMQLFHLQSDGHPEILQLNLPLEAVESATEKA
jgi:probable phosphoglycerate mutase